MLIAGTNGCRGRTGQQGKPGQRPMLPPACFGCGGRRRGAVSGRGRGAVESTLIRFSAKASKFVPSSTENIRGQALAGARGIGIQHSHLGGRRYDGRLGVRNHVRFASRSDQINAVPRSDAMCQSRRNAPQQKGSLFDHVVGAGEQHAPHAYLNPLGTPRHAFADGAAPKTLCDEALVQPRRAGESAEPSARRDHHAGRSLAGTPRLSGSRTAAGRKQAGGLTGLPIPVIVS